MQDNPLFNVAKNFFTIDMVNAEAAKNFFYFRVQKKPLEKEGLLILNRNRKNQNSTFLLVLFATSKTKALATNIDE